MGQGVEGGRGGEGRGPCAAQWEPLFSDGQQEHAACGEVGVAWPVACALGITVGLLRSSSLGEDACCVFGPLLVSQEESWQ